MNATPQDTLSDRLTAQVPRYTSYPTAPHFHPGVATPTYREWLKALPGDVGISLYLHIPYCDRLCWFCACNTRQTRQYGPVTRYLAALHKEIEAVAALLDPSIVVQSVHFGGGSPTMLAPADIVALDRRLRQAFNYAPDAEISVEIEPNDMDEARFDALAAIGMTRVSLGVQDFDPKVQAAINREQSFDLTRSAVEGARSRGARSVNLDLVYGLPHQTVAGVEATVRQALQLRPDRIALFGYAHVPWFKKHQTMIDEAWLPDARQRFAQSARAGDVIVEGGYDAIGLDHFALPGDSLAVAMRTGRMHRNFQGYTDDDGEVLIGLGSSSIGRLPQGYIQNNPATGEYERQVGESGFAVSRGYAFREEDLARGWVIERLMCDFAFSPAELARRFPAHAPGILADARRLAEDDRGAVFAEQGDRFVVTPEGRPLVRTVAAGFDTFLRSGKARHSAAV
ncbi:MAG TPA: oxygen-independent coproporphyrinogen III oxidase [Rhizobiales bacterium]|nr:oxygen-independent coproporphyrinogen III oxidase [Hyphomicrobiales bacterium]